MRMSGTKALGIGTAVTAAFITATGIYATVQCKSKDGTLAVVGKAGYSHPHECPTKLELNGDVFESLFHKKRGHVNELGGVSKGDDNIIVARADEEGNLFRFQSPLTKEVFMDTFVNGTNPHPEEIQEELIGFIDRSKPLRGSNSDPKIKQRPEDARQSALVPRRGGGGGRRGGVNSRVPKTVGEVTSEEGKGRASQAQINGVSFFRLDDDVLDPKKKYLPLDEIVGNFPGSQK